MSIAHARAASCLVLAYLGGLGGKAAGISGRACEGGDTDRAVEESARQRAVGLLGCHGVIARALVDGHLDPERASRHDRDARPRQHVALRLRGGHRGELGGGFHALDGEAVGQRRPQARVVPGAPPLLRTRTFRVAPLPPITVFRMEAWVVNDGHAGAASAPPRQARRAVAAATAARRERRMLGGGFWVGWLVACLARVILLRGVWVCVDVGELGSGGPVHRTRRQFALTACLESTSERSEPPLPLLRIWIPFCHVGYNMNESMWESTTQKSDNLK